MPNNNNRTDSTIKKVKTPFGTMYIHVEYDENGNTCGGWISDPGKEPDSTISALVYDLSIGLNEALKGEPK